MQLRPIMVCCALLLGVGAGLGGCGVSCPVGLTRMNETCVDQQVANYAACIRDRTAKLSEESRTRVNNELEVLQVSGASEVSESIIRQFESNDDAETVKTIVRHCYALSGGVAADMPAAPESGSAERPPQATGATFDQTGLSFTLHNGWSKALSIDGASAHLICEAKRTGEGLRLRRRDGQPVVVAPRTSLKVRLDAHYRAFRIPLPQGRGCQYEADLTLSGGGEPVSLTLKGQRDGSDIERRILTLFEFDETGGVQEKARRIAYEDLRSAIREAAIHAPSSVMLEGGTTPSLELVQIARVAGSEVGAPHQTPDLKQIHSLSRSLEVISGAVLPNAEGHDVRSKIYMGSRPGPSDDPESVELQLSLAGQVDGFEIARECHELAILDALSRDAERRKQPAHVSILYLGEAHATASSLLAKQALPDALRDLVNDWQQRISAGIERLRIGAHLEGAGIGGAGVTR